MMKALCVCDFAIDRQVMSQLETLKKHGVEIESIVDERMLSPKTITQFVLRAEQEGVDACEPWGELLEKVRDAEILVTHVSPITSQVIEAGEKLKYVCVLRSSHTNVSVEACRSRGITVVEAPGRNADAVADCTVGLMLAEVRNIARGHRALMDGQWKKQFANVMYTRDLRRCTVGIIGVGIIGRKVIQRVQAFGSRIVVYDPYVPREVLAEQGLETVSLEELLETSDIVSIHLRLSEQTKHFLGEREFARMKKTAYFINTARAGLVDEPALIRALQEKQIGGAALDVFETEPLEADSPYLSLDNVTITPHVAGTSIDSFANSVEIMGEELEALLEGRPVPGVVH